jgi:hypothetical protein
MTQWLQADRLTGAPSLLQAGCVVLADAVLGVLVTVSPVLAAACAGATLAAGLLMLERRLASLFVACLLGGLVGYMFFGRGFAYAGVPPLFLSEALLSLAALSLLATFSWRTMSFLHMLLVLFVAWGLIRTLPYVEEYQLDALRDGVVWAYALFALAVSATITPRFFESMVAGYARLVPFFLAWLPVLAVLVLIGVVPLWPHSGARLADFKHGDMAVHLAGVIAFVVSGLYQSHGRGALPLPAWAFWSLAIVDFGFISMSRAGLLTAAAAVATVFIFWPARHLLSFIAVLTVVLSLLAILKPNISVGGYSRQIGPDQLTQNVGSIVGIGGDEDLRGTKEWRQEWWDKVWDYTVNGPYFLAGKGFGVNLADDDGFQVLADDSLRAPHNGHVTILARMGVPGLALWLVMQAWFGWSIFTAFLRARSSGATFWAQVDSWILVYWMAMLLNMSFDVYLEGPQGGIWFWTVFGMGLAALRLQSQPSSGLGAPRGQI